MPGSRFPEWFSGETVNFTKQKNRELKGVVICVVLSINHDIPNNSMMHYYMPGVVDVLAHVLKSGKAVYSTALNIRGVPKTNQEHIHLCRFADFHPLVYFLRDGGTLCVTKKNPPVDKRLELKNSGIHLIFEGDDDYGGDEKSLDQSLKSVSEKMAEFFNSLEDDYHPIAVQPSLKISPNSIRHAGTGREIFIASCNYKCVTITILFFVFLFIYLFICA